MAKRVVILYCGSSLTKGLYDKLLDFQLEPVILPSHAGMGLIDAIEPIGVIITGSPEYVNGPFAPQVDPLLYQAQIPLLGICYGMQLMARDLGGSVVRMAKPERGCVLMEFTETASPLFSDFTPAGMPTWMLHTCKIATIPPGFTITGKTQHTEVAAMEDTVRGFYAIQFHPEHKGKDPSSQAGTVVLWNFLNAICNYYI